MKNKSRLILYRSIYTRSSLSLIFQLLIFFFYIYLLYLFSGAYSKTRNIDTSVASTDGHGSRVGRAGRPAGRQQYCSGDQSVAVTHRLWSVCLPVTQRDSEESRGPRVGDKNVMYWGLFFLFFLLTLGIHHIFSMCVFFFLLFPNQT